MVSPLHVYLMRTAPSLWLTGWSEGA